MPIQIQKFRLGSRLVYALLAMIVMVLAWLPRARALDRFATIDEAKWLLRSANFYQALSQQDWANTYQREHPGVTITWAGTAGYIRRFPQYASLAAEQMPGPTRLNRFFRQQNVDPAQLLAAGRLAVVAAIVGALGLSSWFAARLLGAPLAALGFLLIAFDPFYLALSRLLHLDGLVSALMLLSLLAFLSYRYRGRGTVDLVISALAAGLSWLTKSPALFLVPFLGLWLFIEALQEQKTWRALLPRPVWQTLKPLAAWFVLACAVFFLAWPAMWVDPLNTLYRVFSEALTYTAESKQSAYFFNGQIFASGAPSWYFYPVAFLWRTTPVILVGLLLAVFNWARRKKLSLPKDQLKAVAFFTLFAVLYILCMSLGQQKYDRYLLPAYLPLAIVAAWGWQSTWQHQLRWRQTTSPIISHLVSMTLAGAVLIAQAWGAYQTYPYYYNYFNPLLGGAQKAQNVMLLGWGEGLDQAARYLNTLPDARKLRVSAWYGDACFSYFFKGITVGMDENSTLEELKSSDYAVIYIQQYQRQLPSTSILEYFEKLTPEYAVRLNGMDYAWVYNLRANP